MAGVAILTAVAECDQFIVLGPLVAEIAPPHLLGRDTSLLQLGFTVGVALGPAFGSEAGYPTPSRRRRPRRCRPRQRRPDGANEIAAGSAPG